MKIAVKIHRAKLIIILLLTCIILQFSDIAVSQLEYSVDLHKKANFENADEDFLKKREKEVEKKEIKKKMKVLLGERDYENLLKACEKLQQLDPDDKFIDLYKKFAEEGLLEESIKPRTKTSMERVVVEQTPEAIETLKEGVKADVGEEKAEKEVVTSVETKRPLFGKDTRFIILGVVVVFVLVGVVMILRASKKKRVSTIGKEISKDVLLTEELSSDVFSESPDTGVVSGSELYAPEKGVEGESFLAETVEELEEKLPLEEAKEVSAPQGGGKLEGHPKEEFTLPSFDDVLSERGISESVKPSDSQGVDESRLSEGVMGFEEHPSEEEISVSGEYIYDSQSPLEAEKSPEDINVARNGLPLEVEPLLPVSEDKGIPKDLGLQETSSPESDESLSGLDKILDEDIIADVKLPNAQVDFISEVPAEESKEKEVSDKGVESIGIGKGIHKPLEPSEKKPEGSISDLSIDDILDSIDSETPSKEVSDEQTVTLTPEPTVEKEREDWSISDEDSLKLTTFEEVEIESEPVTEKVIEEGTGVDESILSYNEDEDELHIEGLILTPEIVSTEEKKDKIEEPRKDAKKEGSDKESGAGKVDTNAVYNEHYKLGYKALKQRNWKKAIYEFNIALAINPDSAEVKEKLNEARQMKANGEGI